VVGNSGHHSFLYSGGTMTDLGFNTAYGINNAGQVVGSAFGSYSINVHAFISSGGQMTDLGTLDGGVGESQAYGINNAGQVVGFTATYADGYAHPFLWTQGQGMIDLGLLPGGNQGTA